MMGKMKLIERADVYEICVFPGNFVGERVFIDWLLTAGPLAQTTNGFFV